MRLRSTRLTAIANAIRDKFYGAALNMRFDNTTSLDPRITFSRTTNATLTNSAGLIANAPMNLLTFSEQFDNAAWEKTLSTGLAVVTANAVAAPNGTITADLIVGNNASTWIGRNAGAVSAGTYTFSIWLRSDTAQTVDIFLSYGTTDLFSCALTTSWQRFVLTATRAGTVGLFAGINVGNGKNVYAWGAQLELGSTATTYNPTTVKNLLGFTENFDNAAWTKSNAFVQTNLAVNSVFANTGGAAPTSYTQSFATGTSAPSGTASNGNVIYTQTATAQRPLISQAITTVVGVVYTSSMTITEASGLTVADVIGASGVVSTYTLNGASVLGTVLASPGVVTATWTAAATTSGARFGIGVIGNATGSISFHGAQLVQGTSAGDYKATYAAAAAVGYTDIYGQPFAQKLVETTANSGHFVLPSAAVAVPAGASRTFSIYAKAGERSAITLKPNNAENNDVATFNLANGTIGYAAAGLTAAIASVGNGWYLCSVTDTYAGTSANLYYALATSPTASDLQTYTGDGTSGIYIFGAQLSDSASVDPYVYQPVAAPSSVAYYGPRFDYDPVTLAPKGLLIEEQRTNLLQQSQTFATVPWGKLRNTVTANVTVAPDGTTTAFSVIPTAGTGTNYINQTFTFSAATYTSSIYAKANGYNFVQLNHYVSGSYANFDLSNGAVTQSAGVTSTAIVSVGNGWYRCSMTYTSAAGTLNLLVMAITVGTAPSFPTETTDGTSGLFVWGAQLEAGSFATSYIPTVASQVTRAADSASMIGNNFARWYNQINGSLYAEWVETVNTAAFPGNSGGVSLNANSSTPCFEIVPRASDVQGSARGIGGGAVSNIVSLPSAFRNAGTSCKAAMSFSQNPLGNVADFSFNGGAYDSNTSLTANSMVGINQLEIGKQVTSGTTIGTRCFKRITYYSRKLSASEQRGITS